MEVKAMKEILKKDEYRCAECGGIFEYGWTDEEAIKELGDNFNGHFKKEDCAMVCDDCYKKIVSRITN